MSVGFFMKNVTIEPGCISCGSCQFIVPEVFEIISTSQVKKDVDIAHFADLIKEAALKCPVQVIKIKE